jgi:hypothetical protein
MIDPGNLKIQTSNETLVSNLTSIAFTSDVKTDEAPNKKFRPNRSSRYSRSKSFNRTRSFDDRRSRSREDRGRAYSRVRNDFRERSGSRRREKYKRVDFQQRIRESRREVTPGLGRTIITMCNTPYDRIYKSDDYFRNKSKLGPVMIVDSGSLIGQTEFHLLKENFVVDVEKLKSKERFKFGPSRVYDAEKKAKLNLRLGSKSLEATFFIIDGEVPMLLGNDLMEPFEACINCRRIDRVQATKKE